MKDRPLILVVNDDGITAPGIAALTSVAVLHGDVVVVAPDKPQSGMGHAITINSILKVKETLVGSVKGYAVSGTPVDCVKLGVNKLLKRKPDLIVSGINHGSNSSISVIYSGTMSAAVEGALEDIPSIGFSLLDHGYDADFEPAKFFVNKIIDSFFKSGIRDGLCMNVNIPNVSREQIKGIRICRQAKAIWVENFDERVNPAGETYYWLTGKLHLLEEKSDEEIDVVALEDNYVSVVPVQYDMTNYTRIAEVKEVFEDLE